MASIHFPSASAVTNAMATLSPQDRERCVAHQVEGGYDIVAPDDLVDALEADHPVAPLPVPDIASAQALIQLSREPGSAKDRTLLDDVRDAVGQAGIEAQIWFDRAQTWQRTNPYVVQIGKGLKLSDSAMDDLFRQAAGIAA